LEYRIIRAASMRRCNFSLGRSNELESPLAAAYFRGTLHGHAGEHAVWMDALRQSYARRKPLEPCQHPSRLHDHDLREYVALTGYGFGAALTSAPLALMIRDSGYRHAFRFFGIFQGIAILAFAVLLVKPTTPRGIAPARKRIYQGAELTPSETLRTGVFWLLYLIYLLIAFGGMIVTAQLGPIARDFGLESRTIMILGMSTPVLALAVSIDNFANGITRPLSGWLSDVIGRENMMLLIFSLEAAALLGMTIFGRNPYGFILFAALIFLFGEKFSSSFRRSAETVSAFSTRLQIMDCCIPPKGRRL
jgi:hypothetical protein